MLPLQSVLLLMSLLPTMCTFASTAHAGDEHWYRVMFNGTKVGHAFAQRTLSGDHIVNRNQIVLSIKHSDAPTLLQIEVAYDETSDGRRVGFSRRVRSGDVESRVDAHVQGEHLELNWASADGRREQRVTLPADALFAYGEELRLRSTRLITGTQVQLDSFDVESLVPVQVQFQVGEAAPDTATDGTAGLTQVVRTQTMQGETVRTHLWLDSDFVPHRIVMSALGKDLELNLCDRTCALAADQPLDHLASMMFRSPYRIPASAKEGTIRYSLALRPRADAPKEHFGPPETDEQHVTGTDSELHIDVCAHCGAESRGNAPSASALAAALKANPLVQSDNSEISELAKRIVGGETDPAARMRAMAMYVRGNLSGRGDFNGYASALQALHAGVGDCTSYALLLTALARSQGIPTRIAAGIVYAERFHGHHSVFMPHAWVQAWIDQRWQSFDAALDGFDATHIALALGDGDPKRFYAGMSALGNLQMRSAGMLSNGVAGRK